jgi:hypothetical protein
LRLIAAVTLLSACGKAPQDARTPEDAEATEDGTAAVGTTAGERAVLGKVESLPTGVPTKVGSVTVTAEEAYAAASGRHCRQLRLDEGGKTRNRLACQQEDAWFFAADVMQAPPTPSGQSPTTPAAKDREP